MLCKTFAATIVHFMMSINMMLLASLASHSQTGRITLAYNYMQATIRQPQAEGSGPGSGTTTPASSSRASACQAYERHLQRGTCTVAPEPQHLHRGT
jgi:hypothetical protein